MEATAPKRVKIETIKPNEKNPRFIRNEKYKKLLASISAFPDMLLARPIIVDEYGVILGGNMRWRAAKELGHTHVNVVVVKGWTEEQKKEFIVKDNASFGEWDYDMLSGMYDLNVLSDFGVDVPEWFDKTTISESDFVVSDEKVNNELVTLSFRVSPEKASLFYQKAEESGLKKDDFLVSLLDGK